MPTPLSFNQVTFRYHRKSVLDGFSLDLRAGEVTLLAAPNGAGKTTALWLAAGLLQSASGDVRVLDRDPYRERKVLGQVGFVAEGAPLPPAWRGHEVLGFQRDTFPNWDTAEAERLTGIFALDLDARVGTLSRGQRGKLALLAVLATRPEVLLLDEATLGLDVASRRRIASEVLGKVAEGGTTVLLAGHEIAEAESAADRLVVLDKGRASCDEPVADLLARHRIVAWDDSLLPPPDKLQVLPLPSSIGSRALALAWDEELARPWLASGGEVMRADLETVFLALTGDLGLA